MKAITELRRQGKTETTYIKQKKQVPLITYPLLENTGIVKHGMTTRAGGVSKGHFSTLNLSTNRGDDPEAVNENYLRVCEELGISKDQILVSAQTHTTNVKLIDQAEYEKQKAEGNHLRDVDGLVTNLSGICLMTFYADCVPLFFVDPVKKAIGLSHSGWRGTAGKIGKVTIELMQQYYDTNPADLCVAIGPSICIDCYEVSQDVAEVFKKEFPKKLWNILMKEKENGKFQLNLWEANRQILLAAGIPDEQIAMPDLCTCCNHELLFSHRASEGKRGNLAALLYLI